MIDVNVLFMSLKAFWVSRLLVCDPAVHSWAQLPSMYYKPFLLCNSNLIFNFDNARGFSELQCLAPFYRDVLLYYNKAYVLDLEAFKENIAVQSIWANKFITVRKQNTKCVLFLRNWIRSGVNKIIDLDLVDGQLNPDSLLTKIKYKSNIVSEMKLVQKALLLYRNDLKNIVHQTQQQDQVPMKSRFFYQKIYSANMMSSTLIPSYLTSHCEDKEDIVHVFTTKLIKQKEIKIKEFNFKLLHGILPCNVNLKKWKIKESCACDVCGEPQTIEHLLFDCIYVKPLWCLVEEVCIDNITFKKIIGVDKSFHHNNFVSIISFLIYKEWVLLSLQRKHRHGSIVLSLYRHELQTRLKIYTESKTFNESRLLLQIDELIHKCNSE